MFVTLLRLFIAALRLPAGKGLTSWLFFVIFVCVNVTFRCRILGQVWYLIVSFPALYRLSYFYFNHYFEFISKIIDIALRQKSF